jgi:hypothetical protein
MDAAEVLSVPFSMNLGPVSALQIYYVKVIELNKICWPIDVFGFIAVRDIVDCNRNYIFERARDNCQTLTAQVPPQFMGVLTNYI